MDETSTLYGFYDSSATTIGQLKIKSDGQLIFEGDEPESASLLFNGLVTHHNATIKRYRHALERIACNCTDEVCRDIAKGEL